MIITQNRQDFHRSFVLKSARIRSRTKKEPPRQAAARKNRFFRYLLFFSETIRISRSRIFMYSQITVKARPKAAYHSVLFG